jgi:hypothetical protein
MRYQRIWHQPILTFLDRAGGTKKTPQILADQLILLVIPYKGADYAHHITTNPTWIFRPSAGSVIGIRDLHARWHIFHSSRNFYKWN